MKKLILLSLQAFLITVSFAQVGIGTLSPNGASALDISSTTKGLLIPRMTTAQRNVIVSPVAGLIILNLDDQCIDIFDGVNWIKNCGMKITATDTMPMLWTQKANFPSLRYDAVGFSLGSKGYIGTGQSAGVKKKDFWEYDPVTNVWTQRADFGGTARYSAVGMGVSSTIGFLGMGLDGVYKNDWWQYSQVTNTWTLMAFFPGFGRIEAVCFMYGGAVVVGTGRNADTYFQNFYLYNIGGDSWISFPSFPTDAYGLTAFQVSGVPYVGIGYMNQFFPPGYYLNNSVYKFVGSWVPVASLPGAYRHNATAFSAYNFGLVGLGVENTNYHNDFWKYNATADSWEQLIDFGGTERAFAASFSIGNKGYVGTGTNGTEKQDFWEFDLYPQGNVYTAPVPPVPTATMSDGLWTKNNSTLYNNNTGNVGIGLEYAKNKLDIKGVSTRTGTHPTGRPLYVTGITAPDQGVEFRQDNGTQGIGIGYNTIYATGSDANQDLVLLSRGATGSLRFYTNAAERMRMTGAGFLGIGTTTPHAPLQLSNTPASRKFVLTETADNDHQFFGLGINAAVFRYQVDATTANHLFYAGTSSTTSVELMRIQGNGNVGIGFTANVSNKLDIQSAVRSGTHATNLPLYITSSMSDASGGVEIRHTDGTQGVGIGRNTLYAAGSNAVQNLGLAAKGSTGNLIFTTNGAERARMDESGYIGLGTANPFGPIHIASSAGNRRLILYADFDNENQYIGFGVNGDGALRYQTAFSSNDHVFYTGLNATTSDELFRIRGTGNVTIKGIIETENYIAPTLLNGFTNYNGGYVPAGYYKDKEGVVHLHGLVNTAGNPGNVTIFTLPAGYRSTSGAIIFMALNNDATSRIDVLTDGSVKVVAGATGWFSLDGISFKAN